MNADKIKTSRLNYFYFCIGVYLRLIPVFDF